MMKTMNVYWFNQAYATPHHTTPLNSHMMKTMNVYWFNHAYKTPHNTTVT